MFNLSYYHYDAQCLVLTGFHTLVSLSHLPHHCGRIWCHSRFLVVGARWPCSCGPVGKHCRKPSSYDGCCGDLVGHSCLSSEFDPTSDGESEHLPRCWTVLWEHHWTPVWFWSVSSPCAQCAHRPRWSAEECGVHPLYPQLWPVQIWQVTGQVNPSSQTLSGRLGCAQRPVILSATRRPVAYQRHLQLCSGHLAGLRCQRTPGWRQRCYLTEPGVNGTPEQRPPWGRPFAMATDRMSPVVPKRVSTDPHQHQPQMRPLDWGRFVESEPRPRPGGLQIWLWWVDWTQQEGQLG